MILKGNSKGNPDCKFGENPIRLKLSQGKMDAGTFLQLEKCQKCGTVIKNRMGALVQHVFYQVFLKDYINFR